MRIIGKIAAFLAVLATLVWFVRPANGFSFVLHWDRLVALLAAVATYLGMEAYEVKRNKEPHPNDIRLLKRLLSKLTPDGLIPFFREHDFGGAFRSEYAEPILRFSDGWHGSDKEFQNKAVEAKHKSMVTATNKLAHSIAKYTCPVGDGSFSSVLHDDLRNQPRPEWVNIDARKLNDAANEFVAAYDAFLKVACKFIPIES